MNRIMKTHLLPVCLVVLLLSACDKPADPRVSPVAAETPADFAAWKNKTMPRLTNDERAEFDSCVNEIRLGIMQRKEASGAGPVAQKLCEYINGKTMREILVMGHAATVDWVTKELALQRENMQKTETALKGRGSDDAKKEMRDFYALVKNHIENNLEPKLAKAKARLEELRPPSAGMPNNQ